MTAAAGTKNLLTKPTVRFIRHFRPLRWLAVATLACWVLVAALAPVLAPHNVGDIVTTQSFGKAGLLGSDYLGRDVLSRVIFGARITLMLSLATATLAVVVGTLLGMLAGAAGGWIDTLLSRVNDALMAFPAIILALLVISSVGTSALVLVVTVGAIQATRVFRVARSLSIDVNAMDFVEAARARGERHWWIIRREIFPNCVAPLLAEFGMHFTFSMLFVSALSFLGLGVQPPATDWGSMVRENMSGLLYGSLAAITPAIAIASITISINSVIDAILLHTGIHSVNLPT